jgi:hypothetical protein
MTTPFSKEDQDFISFVRTRRPAVVAVVHPEWRGIRRSLEQHCDCVYLLRDHITEESATYYADLFWDAGCPRLVYGALPLSYAHLIRKLHGRHPAVEQFMTWHGSFLQSNEDYNWESFKGVLCLAKEGCLKRIGFVKKGMEVLTSRLGLDVTFYSNFIDKIPERPSEPDPGGPHIGMWAIAPIWRKNPYAMLAASALLGSACLHVRGQDERVRDFAELFSIRLESNSGPLAMEDVEAEMRRMHLNLYVTLSECSPMTPLESLAAGVPCLIGPTSHLFEDDAELFKHLVVPFPDRSTVIHAYMERALQERTAIVERYARYAIGYNQRAKSEFACFLGI